MPYLPPRCEVEVEDDGQTVHLWLSRQEALALAQLIRSTDRRRKLFSERGGERLRGIAKKIVFLTRPAAPVKRAHPNYRVGRPSNAYPNEFDRDHALTGSAPFPLLCMRDLSEVYPQLVAKGLGAPEIAERLHLNERTVYRWFKNPPSWMETYDGETAPAG